jgi:hypothetical protein
MKENKTILESKKLLVNWKDCYGWAPDSAANKMNEGMLEWMSSLTDCLDIWQEKGLNITNGELILGYANLGDLVECWLIFFLCIFYEDYIKNPIFNNGRINEPNKLKYETLKNFCRDKLWKDNEQIDYFVEQVQKRRNAIHSFNKKDIGTPFEYYEMLNYYIDFLDCVINHLPDEPDREYY